MHTPTHTLNIHTYIVKREVKQQHYEQRNKYMIIIIYIIPKIKDNSQKMSCVILIGKWVN